MRHFKWGQWMAFRVFRGGGNNAGNGAASAESADQLGPVLERLDILATMLESLGDTPAPYSTDVSDTLSRMERRDVQALSAIDTFATALKSVSHHLAHLRNSVQSSNAQHGDKLDGLAERLAGIEARLEAGFLEQAPVDFSPMAAALDTISQRLSGLEAKLENMAQQQAQNPFDPEMFATALATIADRLARVEAKVDRVAQQPALEPEATGNLLSAIIQRVGVVEDKVDSGADGTSIAACLLAVDRRLSHIETSLDMGRPLPAAEEIPDLADVVDAQPASSPPTPMHPVAVAQPPASDADAALVPPAPEALSQPDPMPRERVDQLLEQVFKVLAR